MRVFLLFIGWSSLIGSIADGALGLYALWIVTTIDTIGSSLSLDAFLKQFVGFIYWVKQLAFYVMPDGIATWLFNLPALVYFPVRIFFSVVIGWLALRKAEELKVRS